MELRHLEVFLAIVETGTFTAAGQRLHLVQSAVSATLHALETELGARLFVRTARRAILTDAGVALVPEARAALAAAAAARTAVAEVREGVRGPLAVGTMTTTHLVDLPRLLGRFQETHPHVTISLRTLAHGSRDLEAGVLSGELDVAFVSVPGPTPPGLRLRPLARFPMRLLLPLGHPAAVADAVALADLAAERWIDSPPGFGNRTVVDSAFAEDSLTRTVAIEVADVPTLPAYVAAGLGVAVVPGYVPIDPEVVHVRQVRGHDLTWPMSLATATRRPERAVVSAFAAVVAEEVGARIGTA
ncbi:LysR family transcriptional regulator [Cellulomonas sp. P24]|uniref:LysR family transcriptional regulator n=1 Tax=Cellulomonas sp. P24 TaxID=2885206 RepID=UPI00216B2EB8|nr:LysR family transcriptional regulator [Cellulomonas sp. P24]MCR6491534.1 LysR family transcriptional regulator [Cellulomonas sp. P24]